MALDGELVWYAEIDPAASKVLAKHYPGVPNLGDITKIDWATVPKVEVITGGYPCQPFSVAGNRKGKTDERHLWPYVLDCICNLRPDFALLENVAGHLTLGFPDVLTDLAKAGWSAEWTTLRASDIGAAHRRERLFFIAYSDEQRLQRHRTHVCETSPKRCRHLKPCVCFAADTKHAERFRDGKTEELGQRHDLRADFGQYWLAVSRWANVIGRPAPKPLSVRHDGRKQLNAEFVEWMMGLPPGWVTGHDLSRSNTFKMLGNGVVPEQASAALKLLLERFER